MPSTRAAEVAKELGLGQSCDRGGKAGHGRMDAMSSRLPFEHYVRIGETLAKEETSR